MSCSRARAAALSSSGSVQDAGRLVGEVLTSTIAVVDSQLGDRAGVHGARRMVIDQVFSAAAVDATLLTEQAKDA